MHPVVRVVVLGCSQDAGVPQMGCSCHQCDRARRQPSYKDGMVTCLGIVDEEESKVFIVDATPDLRNQLWAIQHPEQEGCNNRPLELGGILLTHAHTGHYTGLLQLGKEGADTRDIPVFCTPSMASFLRGNQPWAQLVERRNISIREVLTWNKQAPISTRLTSLVSFLPVLVPHRAELSDTVAYLITASRSRASEGTLVPDPEPLAGTRDSARECDAGAGTGDTLKVSHPVVQETVKVLADCGTEVVLTHFNHTNPILSKESLERATVLAKGFKVATFGMEWTLRG